MIDIIRLIWTGLIGPDQIDGFKQLQTACNDSQFMEQMEFLWLKEWDKNKEER